MACELWAIDAGAGEAILKEGDRWYLSSMDHAWRPIEMESPRGVLEWSLSRHVVPVSREFADLDRAVITARHLCRSAWRTGGISSEEVDRLLAGEGPARAGNEWEERLPEILRQAVQLDHFFQAKGVRSEESLRFTLRVVQGLRDSGEWRGLQGHDLVLRLFNDARALYLREREEGPETSGRGLSDYQQRLYRKNLRSLSFEELSCLALWADAKYSVEEVATVLGLSSELVQGRLFRAAGEMGRPLEQLRDPALADFCRTLLNPPG